MDSALWTAKSGLDAHHKNIAIISNNLANSNTVGFKRNRPEFEDLPYQVMQQPGSPTTNETNSPNGIVIGTGVRLADNKKIFTDGSALQTDNALDIAIEGRGFLQIQVPNQTDLVYTRTGSMQINEQGQLVMHSGYIIQPPITIPPQAQKITISKDGFVSVITSSNATEELGRLELVDFINTAGLQPIGENLYKETISSGTPSTGYPTLDGFGSLHQGELEASNVNVVEEMVNLIEAQRAFEMTSKAISAIDGMLENLNRDL